MEKEEPVPKNEAIREMKNMITRTALLPYAFTRTLMEELEEEKALAVKAIKRYGGFVGQKARGPGKDHEAAFYILSAWLKFEHSALFLILQFIKIIYFLGKIRYKSKLDNFVRSLNFRFPVIANDLDSGFHRRDDFL